MTYAPAWTMVLNEIRNTRKQYHLTLAMLIDILRVFKNHGVVIEGGYGLTGRMYSYRGYYEDLCLEYDNEIEPIPAKSLLESCEMVLNTDLTGYKGGEYRMAGDTPLWVSEGPSCTGPAVVGYTDNYDELVLRLKDVD